MILFKSFKYSLLLSFIIYFFAAFRVNANACDNKIIVRIIIIMRRKEAAEEEQQEQGSERKVKKKKTLKC